MWLSKELITLCRTLRGWNATYRVVYTVVCGKQERMRCGRGFHRFQLVASHLLVLVPNLLDARKLILACGTLRLNVGPLLEAVEAKHVLLRTS